ncbi:lysine--tRNA ligase [Methanococcoides burtonii]|uniref:Lysine--tRNA ligase n=1 Tax=Methanococcoides burtonii (strain DSM 6242 / NBRC 107633 / OCM 468 / ACE-M) TaxID=259564 RepID=Q12UX8_METBU|nr:lysine--tRNA ligase [Methanococcoides burtonii]ABE52748.1 Lysyl-tRNA synthetase [Methanococcoides burtonii DSM 6242]
MTEITHWADVIAEEAAKNGNKHLVSTGITPSGHIHIGNMREVVTADAAYRAMNDAGLESEFIYIADNFDPLRKVYPFLPESYAEHVGKPISEIPCPCGECKSYAEHFLTPFLEGLEKLGIHPKVYRADELYKSGRFVEAIKAALIKRDDIAKILKEVSGKDVLPEWSPFNPICQECKKINTATVTGFDADAETVDYECSCGHSGTVSMIGGGKLTWRVDWPAKWKMLNVTVEPFGKDHASRGGSYDTGKRIVREIFDHEPPQPIVYEWIMLGQKGAMSSSSGVVVSISDMLKVVPPEVLRYLIMRTKPEKHIKFDPAQPLLTLVDEYERLNSNTEIEGLNKRVLELSHAKGICHTDIPFKHMTTIAQVAHGDFDKIMKIIGRAGYDTTNEKCIRELVNNVANWLEMYAPPFAKFSVKDELPEETASLTDEQKAFLGAVSEIIGDSGELTGEDYHNLVYSSKEAGSQLNNKIAAKLGVDDVEINPKDMFKAIYTSVLGQQSGPKAGWFLSSIDQDFLAKRFSEAALYRP